MLSGMRNTFSKWVVGGIIAFIGFVFVFSGVFSPSRTAGMHEGAVAGTVNGEAISLQEFNRELNRRMEFFKNLAGGSLSEEQMKQFRLREGVFAEIVNRKLLTQAAIDAGMSPGEEELRERIRQIPAFQKNGKFDVPTYQAVLQANQQTPGSFERLMREDLAVSRWEKTFRGRTLVSDEEIKREFVISQDRRNIKFVLLTNEQGGKDVLVTGDEIQKYLSDEIKLKAAQAAYERRKQGDLKGKTFDQVKNEIARGLIAASKTEELKAANGKLAAKVASMLTPDKSGDARVNAFLKTYNSEIKSSGLISRTNPYLPGAGEAKELMADAFAGKLNQPKAYNSGAWWIVGVVTETAKADMSKFAAEKAKVRDQILGARERVLVDGLVKELSSKAKIVRNPAVVGDDSNG